MRPCHNDEIWTEEVVWTPSADGCRMLMLDSLRSVKMHLEDTCCTKVQYVPPGITGLSRRIDVRVMRSFKSIIQDHEFSKNASERRLLLSHVIGKAWKMVDDTAIMNGFKDANYLPVVPRDANGKFRTYLLPPPQDVVVDK
ncbi:hypothetical protein GN244_ATG08863 [Phytophthora infestans]|uniref:DDE-1 domain-containing protein n=1 Tax=Phytophthora infestans TaxID=4787 RepID=A0A833SRQ8_PHYIN|nr:hypothetical protein GN244_ATG08863 [Phytophthora infestans]